MSKCLNTWNYHQIVSPLFKLSLMYRLANQITQFHDMVPEREHSSVDRNVSDGDEYQQNHRTYMFIWILCDQRLLCLFGAVPVRRIDHFVNTRHGGASSKTLFSRNTSNNCVIACIKRIPTLLILGLDMIGAAACDFQQCGVLTRADSAEPVQPYSKLRNSKWCSVSSLTFIEYSSDKQMLWADCAYAQADRRLCWSHIPHCWKSHALAHSSMWLSQ